MIFIIIIFAVALFIDGATDCANSVTGAVSSGALSLRRAVFLSCALSFLGCFVFCLFLPRVAVNSASALSLPEHAAVPALCAVLLSVSLWSAFAWIFGLPTSEGHGIVAAAAGCALALGGDIHLSRLMLIILSAPAAALLSAFAAFLFTRLIKDKYSHAYKLPLIVCCAVSSFFHGAQDGQKFLSLAISASVIHGGTSSIFALFAAAFMAFGTLFGSRIIKKMGGEMAVADVPAALCADLGSALSLALLTAVGIPASTTHMKMTALAAASRSRSNRTSGETFLLLIAAWIFTFPVCFSLSFFLSKAFFAIFL